MLHFAVVLQLGGRVIRYTRSDRAVVESFGCNVCCDQGFALTIHSNARRPRHVGYFSLFTFCVDTDKRPTSFLSLPRKAGNYLNTIRFTTHADLLAIATQQIDHQGLLATGTCPTLTWAQCAQHRNDMNNAYHVGRMAGSNPRRAPTASSRNAFTGAVGRAQDAVGCCSPTHNKWRVSL